jgi:hypothetical protein
MPLLRERRLDLLLHFDQLSICKKAGEIFQGFEEPPIDFFPVFFFFFFFSFFFLPAH